MYSTLLSISPSGTGPNVFESRVWNRSSPSIQQCPGGTRTVGSECGGSVRTSVLGMATSRLMSREEGSEGDLCRHRGIHQLFPYALRARCRRRPTKLT